MCAGVVASRRLNACAVNMQPTGLEGLASIAILWAARPGLRTRRPRRSRALVSAPVARPGRPSCAGRSRAGRRPALGQHAVALGQKGLAQHLQDVFGAIAHTIRCAPAPRRCARRWRRAARCSSHRGRCPRVPPGIHQGGHGGAGNRRGSRCWPGARFRSRRSVRARHRTRGRRCRRAAGHFGAGQGLDG